MTTIDIGKAAAEIANQCIGPASATLTSFDNTVEAHLDRIDEMTALVESIRGEVAHTVDTAFPMLLQNTKELAALFTVLDATEDAINRSYAAAKASSDRLDTLQQGYDTKYPEGISKLTSWFGTKSKVADAPVKLPPFDPSSARIPVDQMVTHLQSIVGEVSAVQADKLAAFMAETEGTEEEEEGINNDDNHPEENTLPNENGTTTTTIPVVSTTTTTRKIISSGEDDEEEDDEEDD